jgi:hypothetical protein
VNLLGKLWGMKPLSRPQKLAHIAAAAVASWLIVIAIIWMVMIAPGMTVALFAAAVLMSVWSWKI